jgi:hypothetical protein
MLKPRQTEHYPASRTGATNSKHQLRRDSTLR